jgi:hypothetical protein
VDAAFDQVRQDGGADVLVHLAGHYDFTGQRHPDYQAVNVVGMRHVLDATARIGVPTVVFTSSVAACQFPPAGQSLTEDSPPDGDTPYAESKRAGEEMIAEYRHAFRGIVIRFAALFSDWCEYEPLFHFLESWFARSTTHRVQAGWAPRARLGILRRMPFFVEHRKTYPTEWHRRNHPAMRRMRRYDNLRIHQLLEMRAESICTKTTDRLLTGPRTGAFGAYHRLSRDQLCDQHRMLIEELMMAVRTAEKRHLPRGLPRAGRPLAGARVLSRGHLPGARGAARRLPHRPSRRRERRSLGSCPARPCVDDLSVRGRRRARGVRG